MYIKQSVMSLTTDLVWNLSQGLRIPRAEQFKHESEREGVLSDLVYEATIPVVSLLGKCTTKTENTANYPNRHRPAILKENVCKQNPTTQHTKNVTVAKLASS